MKTPNFVRILVVCVVVAAGWIFLYSPAGARRMSVTPTVIQGFKVAQQCYPTRWMKLKFERLYVVPGKTFDVLWNGPKTGYTLMNRVFVVERDTGDVDAWAHEFLHSFAIVGHPPQIFARCHL
jgi:hypothetical protein